MSVNFEFLPPPMVAAYLASELLVQRYKCRDYDAQVFDQGTLFALIGVAISSLGLCKLAMVGLPQAHLEALHDIAPPAIGVFVCGVFLRWYSIIHLGRYFTTQVAILSGHELVESGPFRYLRHPSYTGVLLQLLAIGIRSENIVALAALMLPNIPMFLYRIRIEEAALTSALGEPYVEYMKRTKRLVPFLY